MNIYGPKNWLSALFLTSFIACGGANAQAQTQAPRAAEESRTERLEKRAERFKEASWAKLALSLTGESPEIEMLAKRKLKQMPDLARILRKELGGPYTPLALDVIGTLELKDFFNDLLVLSERDEDGFITQTLNMLLDEKNLDQLIKTYLDRLSQDESSVYYSGPAKASMIDTLDRLQVEFSSKLYKKLFDDSNFEVRMMTFHHLRNALMRSQNPNLLPALKTAMMQAPQQLRISAIHLVGELNGPLQKEASSLLNRCVQDSSMKVRSECQATVDSILSPQKKGKEP